MNIVHKDLGFRLVDIRVVTFEIHQGQIPLEADVAIAAQLSWKLEPAQHTVIASLRIDYALASEPLLSITVECAFEIELRAWDESWNLAQQQLELPRPFLIRLGSITIGTMRGILFEKTAKTGHSPFLLPLLEVDRLLTDYVLVGAPST